jgi:hypothetical protein
MIIKIEFEDWVLAGVICVWVKCVGGVVAESGWQWLGGTLWAVHY